MEGLECYPFMSDMREGLDGYKVWDRDWYQYQIQRRETEKVQFDEEDGRSGKEEEEVEVVARP